MCVQEMQYFFHVNKDAGLSCKSTKCICLFMQKMKKTYENYVLYTLLEKRRKNW